MWKDVKNAFGTRKVYEDFIDNSYEMVREIGKTPLGLRQLVRAEIDILYKPVINPKTGKQARMTVEEMFEAGYPLGKIGEQVKKIKESKKLTEDQKKEKLKKLDKTGAGPPKWKFVDPGVEAY